jgi:hypothetical protein
VIKVFKDEILNENPKMIAVRVAHQLITYAKNMRNDVLKNHVAEHKNLREHLQYINEDFALCREYVKDKKSLAFQFVEYVPDNFPLDNFSKNDPVWNQLREIFRATKEARIPNDSRRDNLRVNREGKVLFTDMMEEDSSIDSMDAFLADLKEQLRSFTDQKSEIEWLLS